MVPKFLGIILVEDLSSSNYLVVLPSLFAVYSLWLLISHCCSVAPRPLHSSLGMRPLAQLPVTHSRSSVGDGFEAAKLGQGLGMRRCSPQLFIVYIYKTKHAIPIMKQKVLLCI